MSLDDRDWYREEMRRRARERDAAPVRVPRGPAFPWRAGLLTVAIIGVLAIVVDISAMGAPLTPKGVKFWWSVKTGAR